jgi:hypothetical protein
MLTVEFVRGADPSLTMTRPDGTEEQIAVAGWTKQNFQDFFEAKMVKEPAVVPAAKAADSGAAAADEHVKSEL